MRYSTKTNRLKWNTKIYLYSTKEGRKLEAEKPKQRGQTKHKNKLVDLNQNILNGSRLNTQIKGKPDRDLKKKKKTKSLL